MSISSGFNVKLNTLRYVSFVYLRMHISYGYSITECYSRDVFLARLVPKLRNPEYALNHVAAWVYLRRTKYLMTSDKVSAETCSFYISSATVFILMNWTS